MVSLKDDMAILKVSLSCTQEQFVSMLENYYIQQCGQVTSDPQPFPYDAILRKFEDMEKNLNAEADAEQDSQVMDSQPMDSSSVYEPKSKEVMEDPEVMDSQQDDEEPKSKKVKTEP